MLDLIILIILGFGFLIGLKRGFILQIIHLTGFIIAFIIAYLYYDQLAPKLTLWVPFPNFSSDSALSLVMENVNLEDAYYRAIAFVVIFFAVKIILQIIGSMLDFIAQIPVLKQLNVWAGGSIRFSRSLSNYLYCLIYRSLITDGGNPIGLDPIYSSRINRSTYTRFFLRLSMIGGL